MQRPYLRTLLALTLTLGNRTNSNIQAPFFARAVLNRTALSDPLSGFIVVRSKAYGEVLWRNDHSPIVRSVSLQWQQVLQPLHKATVAARLTTSLAMAVHSVKKDITRLVSLISHPNLRWLSLHVLGGYVHSNAPSFLPSASSSAHTISSATRYIQHAPTANTWNQVAV